MFDPTRILAWVPRSGRRGPAAPPSRHPVLLRACLGVEALDRRILPSGSSFPMPTGGPGPSCADQVTFIRGPSAKHRGYDIVLSQDGTTTVPVPTAEAGVVVFAHGGNNGGFGNEVIVEYSDGTAQLFGHLSAIDVQVGQRVGAGQAIGFQGNTGHVIPSPGGTGIHLHTEIGVIGPPNRKRQAGFIRSPDVGASDQFVAEYMGALRQGAFTGQCLVPPPPPPPPSPMPSPQPMTIPTDGDEPFPGGPDSDGDNDSALA